MDYVGVVTVACAKVDAEDADRDGRTDGVWHPPDVGPSPGWSQESSTLLVGT